MSSIIFPYFCDLLRELYKSFNKISFSLTVAEQLKLFAALKGTPDPEVKHVSRFHFHYYMFAELFTRSRVAELARCYDHELGVGHYEEKGEVTSRLSVVTRPRMVSDLASECIVHAL